jgi:uncharacterized protein (TIGR00251 family)
MIVERMITVSVRVHPGASREGVVLLPDGSLDVRLRARAVEGQANAGLLVLLADRLRLGRRGVEIVAGERSRQKRVRLDLASNDELRDRLGTGVSVNGDG